MNPLPSDSVLLLFFFLSEMPILFPDILLLFAKAYLTK